MEQAWVDSLYAQCRTAHVPFFFKQWGGRQKAKTGRTLHGRTYDEMPPVIEQTAPAKNSGMTSSRSSAKTVALHLRTSLG